MKNNILNIRGSASAVIALMIGLSSVSTPYVAQAETLSRSALIGLAKEFVDRVGSGFEQADQRLQNEISPDEPATPGADRIPDGEEILLQLVAGDRNIPLNFEVIAIKQPHGADILMEDFFAAVDFPIRVNADSGLAEGWFFREEQTFRLNINDTTLAINGEDVPLYDADVYEADGDIFVQSAALERWFNMEFLFNYEELRAKIESQQPLPAIERYNRSNRDRRVSATRNDPTLPFEDLEYGAADIPNLDVSLRSNYFRSGDNDPITRHSWSVIGAGDFAYLNTQAFLGGNDDDILSTARLNFTRQSENADLLGPLNARTFAFGDVNTTRLQMTGPSQQQQGVRVTNEPLDRRTRFNTTYFRGNAQPGWDAELYRGATLLDTQQIGNDGIYDFQDIPLFAGPNDFRIILYGPQGEIREIAENIPVSGSNFADQQTYYDVSVSRSNIITYDKNRLERPQDGAPRVTARLDRGLNENVAISAGIESRDEGDQRRSYLEGGISTFFGGTFVDLNTAYELSESEAAAEAIIRRNFGAHAFRGGTYVATDGFQPNLLEDNNPVVFETNLLIDGPARNFFGFRSGYTADLDYRQRADGARQILSSLGYNTRLARTTLNTGISFENQNGFNTLRDDENILSLFGNARGFYKGGFYRLGGRFDISPETEFDSVFASYNYPFTPQLDGLVEVNHSMNPARTRIIGSMNWKADKATVSPRISYSTDDIVQASLNVRFGVGYNPGTSEFNMYNQRLTSTGGVSARIFLDENGNGILDEGEELISNARLTAPQVRRNAYSDENGIAFIPNLPEGVVTDIQIDNSSLYDPFYISNFAGISMRPRRGVVKQIDFPVVISGEIDGTVYFSDNDGARVPARQFNINLVAPWGEVVQSARTAYDGFYVFDQIPPGIYYMVADYQDLKFTNREAPMPQKIYIRPDGTTIYGKDFTLSTGAPVRYAFKSDITPPNNRNRTVLQETGVPEYSLQLGPFRSNLAAGLALYKMNRINHVDLNDIQITETLNNIERDKNDKMLWIPTETAKKSLADHTKACAVLMEKSIPCQITIHTPKASEDATSELASAL